MRELAKLGYIVLVLFVSAGLVTAQSLAEVAKKEKKRRQTNQSEAKQVITDRELAGGYGGLPTATAQASSDAADESEDAASTGEESEEAEPQDETKTREYWEGRAGAAKEKIAGLEKKLAEDDWGTGQRAGVDPRGLNNLTSRQKAEQDLAAARAELEAVRAEARKSGVPPGWTR